MAHVGVQRFTAGDDEEDAAEGEERPARVLREELDDVHRVDGTQNLRSGEDLSQTQDAEHGEPHDHHRPEDPSDATCPPALNEEQTEEDHAGERDDVALERRGRDLEALHRAEHRDRRRDQTVAVEEAGPEHAEHHERALQPVGDPAPSA